MEIAVLVVVIDFKKYLDSLKFKVAEIMLAVGIIGGAKVVKGGDSVG